MKDAEVCQRQATFAKAMRRNMTEPERKLWKALRWPIPLNGTHFRRDVPLGPYMADFCSYGAKIVIEADGNQHGTPEAGERDAARSAFIDAQGDRVLRFSNCDVVRDIEMVLDTIQAALDSTPDPSPLEGGEWRDDDG